MFLDARLLFLFAETPLHAGMGSGLGAVDLPVQRERVTGYPIVQASGIKGALRSEAGNSAEVAALFGPEKIETNESAYAGAISPTDARLLLLPVRSLSGVFAWTTSIDLLARFARAAANVTLAEAIPALPGALAEDEAYVSGVAPKLGDAIVLEEFSFKAVPDEGGKTAKIAEWLAKHALPQDPVYNHWRNKLLSSLVILPENAMRDFAMHATEIVTRVRLDNETKTVETGALWTQELLPVDTLLYSTVHATRLRMSDDKPSSLADDEASVEAKNVLNWLTDANNVHHQIQIGGDETVGRGLVRLTWQGGA